MKVLVVCSKCKSARNIVRRKNTPKYSPFWCTKCRGMVYPNSEVPSWKLSDIN